MTKKAKRIMVETYLRCKHEIKIFGYDGYGFDKMADSNNELIYKRTMNEMIDILNGWKHDAEMKRKYNIFKEDEYILECQVLDMLEKTMANQYIA